MRTSSARRHCFAERAWLVGIVLVTAAAAFADRAGPVILNPKTYHSPTGEFELWVNPSTMLGQAQGTYRLTRTGVEQWAGELPFTLWDAQMLDDGSVAGYAYSGGMENDILDGAEGQVRLVILDPQGHPRLDEALPRRGSYACTDDVDREIAGVVVDAEHDRVVFRCEHGGWNHYGEEYWRVYRLSNGSFVDAFEFAHPRHTNDENWYPQTVQPVAGTPLLLVNWEYSNSEKSRSADSLPDDSSVFTLLDASYAAAWEKSVPGDYADCEYELARQLRNGAAVLRTDQLGRFDVWFVKERQRVTFAVTQDAAGQWQVKEIDNARYNGPAAAAPTSQPAPPETLRLRHLGTIALDWQASTPPAIRDIEDFGFDDQGRIGILRSRELSERGYSVLLAQPDGEVLHTINLRETAAGVLRSPAELSYLGDERWVVACSLLSKPESNDSYWIAQAWTIDFTAGTVTPFFDFPHARVETLTERPRGGCVAVITPETGGPTFVGAFDMQGHEVWRFTPDSNWLNSAIDVTETDNGLVLVLYSYGSSIATFDSDGRLICCDQCQRIFSPEYRWPNAIVAGPGGTLYIADRDSDSAQMRTDWSLVRKLLPHHPDGRTIQLPDNGVRVAPDQGVWITDEYCLMRLDKQGGVDRVLGEPPDALALRHVGGVDISQDGTIAIAEKRSRVTHVFDAGGKRLRVLRPLPTDFDDSYDFDVSVLDDQRVFVDGIEFTPTGERIGRRKLPDALEDALKWFGRVVYQPNGNCWMVLMNQVVLTQPDGTELKRVERRPDGNWLNHVEAAAMGPDGGLALLSGTLGDWESAAQRISTYTSAGEPLMTAPLPPYDHVPSWNTIQFNGRYVLLGPWGYEDVRYLLLDTQAVPPKWYDVGSLMPYDDWWRRFIVRDGRELWLFAEQARKIERFALPEGD